MKLVYSDSCQNDRTREKDLALSDKGLSHITFFRASQGRLRLGVQSYALEFSKCQMSEQTCATMKEKADVNIVEESCHCSCVCTSG